MLCSGLNDSLDSDADTNTSLLKGEQNIIYFSKSLEGNRLVSPTGRGPGRGGAEGMSWQGR